LRSAPALWARLATPWRRSWSRTGGRSYRSTSRWNRGIHEFSVFYLAENRPVAALLAHAGGASRQLIKQGIAERAVAVDRGELAAAPRHPDGPAPRPQDR
jgi:hypothetical protein